jgi:GT2 family glycosyltransferase
MNRLHTVRQSLPANIETDKNREVEFVLLDYNSSDGLEEWIRSHMLRHIEDGRLKYYAVLDPKPRYFSPSHSRNLAFRLAKASVLCNINADYFVAPTFLKNWSTIMKNKKTAIVTGLYSGRGDNKGRLCVHRNDFLAVGGYNERFISYGYEDIDLYMRLIQSGVTIKKMHSRYWGKSIVHGNVERTINSFDYHNINSVYVRKLRPGITEIIFQFKSGQVQMGTLEKSGHDIPFLMEPRWVEGAYTINKRGIRVVLDGTEIDLLVAGSRTGQQSEYTQIRNDRQIKDLIFLKSQVYNYRLMRDGIKAHQIKVNPSGFGIGLVRKNFRDEIRLTPF